MKRRVLRLVLLIAIDCGGPNVAPPAFTPTPLPSPTAAAAAPVVLAPGRLGHYSSGDGLTGFVLDRTGSAPRVRMDGTTEVLELEPQSPATDEHADFVHTKAHVFLRLESNGRITFARG